ncbi:hypothetical protein FB446DRAFT_815235 [Lentinula raphanica]|nr:hypothetical protein FB446DRAFT_815235 [Lentinula raphanica]
MDSLAPKAEVKRNGTWSEIQSADLVPGDIKLNEIKHKAIVTRITVIEELAGVAILCSDKTGTLTTDKLTIDRNTIKTYGPFSADEDIPLAAYASPRAGIKLLVLAWIFLTATPPRRSLYSFLNSSPYLDSLIYFVTLLTMGNIASCCDSCFGSRRSPAYEPLLLENEREAVADLLQYYLKNRTTTNFFSGEPLVALTTLSFSDNADLQRSAELAFAEITEKEVHPVGRDTLDPILFLLNSHDAEVQRAASAA